MNIGVVVDNDFNNDIRVTKEVDILKRNGFNVFVLCFAFDGKAYENIEGIQIIRIRIRKKIKDILFLLFNILPIYELFWTLKISKFIKRNYVEILHVHDLYMSKSSNKAIKKVKNNCRLVLDLHENYPVAVQSYNWANGKLRRIIVQPKAWIKKEAEYISYPSKIIVLSELFKQVLLNRYEFLNSDNIIVFPNVIDIKRFETYKIKTEIKKSDNVTLFYFGGIAERRGVFDVINAFRIVLEKYKNIELLLIGPVDKADKDRFFNEIKKCKKNIIYKDWIEISDLPTYLYISDICLAPFIKNQQHESGVANKIFQYMFGAKPIIASNCRPQQELIEKCNCGLIYANRSELIENIQILINNSLLRKQMGENGYNYLYKYFNNVTFEQKLINIYKKNKI